VLAAVAFFLIVLTRGPTMSIETAVLALVVFGGAAKIADEARRMVHDDRQHHYGSEME
jgi:hypothetical protein